MFLHLMPSCKKPTVRFEIVFKPYFDLDNVQQQRSWRCQERCC